MGNSAMTFTAEKYGSGIVVEIDRSEANRNLVIRSNGQRGDQVPIYVVSRNKFAPWYNEINGLIALRPDHLHSFQLCLEGLSFNGRPIIYNSEQTCFV
jgi:hypothetical protein